MTDSISQKTARRMTLHAQIKKSKETGTVF
jgi:hypothetical protein